LLHIFEEYPFIIREISLSFRMEVDKLNPDTSTWEGWFYSIVLMAAKDPWGFLYYVFLVLSPMFAISLFLTWKLTKELEAKEKDKKRKAKRDSNIAKARKANKAD
jgi:Uncharacterised protein family UPF0542